MRARWLSRPPSQMDHASPNQKMEYLPLRRSTAHWIWPEGQAIRCGSGLLGDDGVAAGPFELMHYLWS
jgi:hypothetical protein